MITDVNRDFYDTLYGGQGALRFLLHGRLSFDQRSKTGPNLAVASPVIRRLAARRETVRVLDYGCGWGTFLLALPRRGIECYGFDLSARALDGVGGAMRMSRRRFAAAAVGTDGRIVPGDMDFILCSHVLEHVPDDVALLRELVRALKPQGHLLVNIPINDDRDDPRHARRYDEAALVGRMKEAGVAITLTREAGRLSGAVEDSSLGVSSRGPRRRALARGLLAIPPYGCLNWLDRQLFRKRMPRQLLVLGVKTDAGDH
jgi:2-polyprenyl-3-methyl-5-hydroxy-6-metoxy-1,4-benzoquinol methylase